MNYRFTLSHPSFGSQVISQPDGWRDAVVKLERHPDFHSLVEYFEGSFIFYGSNGIEDGGVEIIKDILAIGINEELIITIEITENDSDWDMVFTGTLDLSLKEHMPMNKIKVPIVPDDFWTKFIKRFDTPVDILSSTSLDDESIDVPGNINIALSSQLLQQRFSARHPYSVSFFDLSTSDYVQVDWDTVELDEIDEKFSLPIFGNPEIPAWIFEFEYAGDYEFEISIPFSRAHVEFGDPIEATWENVDGWIDLFIQVNEGTPVQFSEANGTTSYGDHYTVFTYIGTLTVTAGSVVRIYADVLQTMNRGDDGLVLLGNWAVGATSDAWTGSPFTFDFNGAAWLEENIDNIINVVGYTLYPETESEGFLLHDVGAQISDRITGQNDSFYSEYLGSDQTITRQYDEDGCGWIYALVKGLQLRLYSLIEKPFFLSFKDWWEGANPILNLSLSYETIEYSTKVIRVEEKAYQYDSSSNSVEFDNIRDIVITFDNELHFNKIEQGYSKWESEDVSGIDDPQTKHTYASIFSKIGTAFRNFSSFMAASLGIEITRRKTRKKSADYKHDNETFIIAINPETEYGNFVPELDENFSSVTNLLNSETRYNIRLTPKRNLTRWMNYLAMGLQSYLSSSLKFVRGEGNYDTTTTINPGCGEVETELDEKADLPVAGFDPLFIPEVYKMTLPMGWDAYQTIQENKKKSIGVSQTESDHTQFFIKTLEFNPFAGQAVVHAWPKVHMDLDIIDIAPELVDCVPPSEPVPSYRITEEGDFRITEDNQFRII